MHRYNVSALLARREATNQPTTGDARAHSGLRLLGIRHAVCAERRCRLNILPNTANVIFFIPCAVTVMNYTHQNTAHKMYKITTYP